MLGRSAAEAGTVCKGMVRQGVLRQVQMLVLHRRRMLLPLSLPLCYRFRCATAAVAAAAAALLSSCTHLLQWFPQFLLPVELVVGGLPRLAQATFRAWGVGRREGKRVGSSGRWATNNGDRPLQQQQQQPEHPAAPGMPNERPEWLHSEPVYTKWLLSPPPPFESAGLAHLGCRQRILGSVILQLGPSQQHILQALPLQFCDGHGWGLQEAGGAGAGAGCQMVSRSTAQRAQHGTAQRARHRAARTAANVACTCPDPGCWQQL
jgi:hypothetical protein